MDSTHAVPVTRAMTANTCLVNQHETRGIAESLTSADKVSMEINVAGTKALGDYLVSEIANVRTLMGLAPQANALPLRSAPSSGTPTVSSSGTPAVAATDFRALALSQALANTEALFGIQSATGANASSLPVLSTQTPREIAYAAIQSSQIAAQFSNIATLFGPGGGIESTINPKG